MKKKVVLITGGAKGIGASLVKTFVQQNYDIILHYNKSEDLAKKLKTEIELEFNIKVLLIKADLCSELQIKKLFDITVENYKSIDVLINHAALSIDNPIEEKTKEEFMKVLETNVVAPFLITKYFKEITKTIINISSLDSITTYNEFSIDYCASKAALNSLTQTTSLACPNVKIISIMLPWVNTETIQEMNPEFLNNELKRTKQKKLIEPYQVSERIIKLLNKNIKSGAIIKWRI